MPDQTNQTRVERELDLTRALIRASALQEDLATFVTELYGLPIRTIRTIRTKTGKFATDVTQVVDLLRRAGVAEKMHPRADAVVPRDSYVAALMRAHIVHELTARLTVPAWSYTFELSPTFNAEARGWPIHVTSQKRSTEGVVWLGDALTIWYDTYDDVRMPVSNLAAFLYEDESVESEA